VGILAAIRPCHDPCSFDTVERMGIRHRLWSIATLLVLIIVLSACAAGVNPEVGTAAGDGVLAGFWRGLWHGIIAPITFIISLFTDNVNVYEVHNSGNWYDFGFVLGAGILFGGGGIGGGRRKR
jgi:hypothetical protein